MGITPDRHPGPLEEEEIQLEDRTLDGNPTINGAIRYVSGDIVAKTPTGVKSLTAGAAGGEANDGANVGAGEGNVYRDKTGVTLNFKTLKQGTGVTITDNADEVEIAAAGATDTRIISISFASNDGTLGLTVSTGDYELKGNFIWPGTSYLGSPISAKVTCYMDKAGSGYFKIYDLTNGQQICEAFNTTTGAWVILDLGTLSNVSAGEAIWEFWMKATGTPKAPDFTVGSFQVKF